MEAQEAQKHEVRAETMERALKVGPRASIVDVRLLDLKATSGELRDTSPTQSRSSRGHSFRRAEGSDILIVTLAFGHDLAYEDDESKDRPAYSVGATFGLMYTVREMSELEDADLDAFAQVNGFFNARPFWRELVTSTYTRLGESMIILPTLRIAEVASPTKPKD